MITTVGTVYADEYTIDKSFPIPDNSTKTHEQCTLESITDNEVDFSCDFTFKAEDAQKWYDDLVGVNQTASEPEPIIVDTPPTYREKQLERYEDVLERMLEIEEPDSHEREYIALLENLAECRSGYGQSKGIFEDNWFPISYTWINDGEAWLKSFDYTGMEARTS